MCADTLKTRGKRRCPVSTSPAALRRRWPTRRWQRQGAHL